MRPHKNCGMGTWGQVKHHQPPQHFISAGLGWGDAWRGVVSPFPASTHQKICLARARRPSGAIKYYLDAMWSCLASSYCLWDAWEGQCLQQSVQRVCGTLCPHPGSTGEGMFNSVQPAAQHSQAEVISARFGIFRERRDAKGAQGVAGSEQDAAAHPGCSNSKSFSVDLCFFVLVFGRMKDAGDGRRDVKGQRGGGVLVLVLPGPVWCCSVTWYLLDAAQELYGMRPERQPWHWGGILEKRELGLHPTPSYSLQLSLGQEEAWDARGCGRMDWSDRMRTALLSSNLGGFKMAMAA